MFSRIPDSTVLYAISPEVVLQLRSISGLAAVILDIQLETTSGDVACSTVKSGIPENMGIELGISFLAHPYVVIKLFPV